MTGPGTTAASIRSGEKATTAPSVGLAAGPASQVGREDRTRERDVGHGFRECVGDDRRLDPAGERPALVSVVAQLEPAGVAHGPGEALGARRVVEVGHGPRSELPRQLAGGAPELGLFGCVSDVHGVAESMSSTRDERAPRPRSRGNSREPQFGTGECEVRLIRTRFDNR